MEITVSARHTEVSEALRQVAVEKIGRLSRFVEGMDRAEVHFSEERNPRIAAKEVCEVTMEGHGHHVRCKVAAPDGFAAVDAAVAKLEHQLHKLKSKLVRQHKWRRAAAAANGSGSVLVDEDIDADEDAATDGAAPATSTAPADGEPVIVKTKRFPLKPMVPQEAALQLDLVGHDFYFFTNAETGRAAVLYRRSDGNLGLIDQAG